MNEQNNNLNTVPTPQTLQYDMPTPMPNANVGQTAPVNPGIPVNPVVPESAPVVEPAPAPAPQPVIELSSSAPTPTMEQKVAPVIAPQPVVQQPVAPVSNSTIQPVEQPVVSPAPAPVQVDIVPSEPINPIVNNATIAPTMQSTQPTLSPTQPQPMNPTTNMNPVPNTASNGVGFVPNGAPLPKKKNKALLIVIIVAIVAVIACVGIFVVYPMVKKQLTTPKMVYEVAIENVTKQINTTVDDILHDKALFDISLGIDSNMPTISSFSGYTYGINAGVDSTANSAQVGLYMKSSTEEYSLYEYIKDGKKYSRYSTDNQLNFLGEMSEEESNEIFASFKEALDTQSDLSNEDANYLVNKLSELLIASIDEKKLSREETTLKINGENVKVLNNKYVIDNATLEKMIKEISDGLREDKKAVTILANVMDLSEDEVKNKLAYNEDDSNNNDDDETIIINLYTNTGLTKSLGFAIDYNKDEIKTHYYTLDNYFEFEYYSKEEDIETNKDIENKISVVGNKRDKGTNIVVTVNDKKLMNILVTENTDNKLSLTYEVFGDDEASVKGEFKLAIDDNGKRNKTDFEFTMKASDQYINVNLNITLDWTSEVANINTGNAVLVTDADIQNKANELMGQLSKTPVGILLQTISGELSSNVQDYYNENNNDYVSITPEESDNPVMVG